MLPTVASVTRICLSELPYIRAFVRYALGAGITYFHFIVCRSEEMIRIERFISSFLPEPLFSLHSAYDAPTPNQALLRFNTESLVQTDYAVLLDGDEYIHSPQFSRLDDYIKATGSQSSYFLPWILAPCDFSLSQFKSGFLGHTGKHLARTDLIASVHTLHSFKLRDSEPIPLFTFDSTIKMFVLHYWSRGLKDALLKCIYYRNFTPCKQSDRKELLKAIQGDCLPMRLRMLAGLCLLPRYICLPSGAEDYFDKELESELLDMSLEALQSLEVRYRDYQCQLNGHHCLDLYPYPGGIQRWSTLLP